MKFEKGDMVKWFELYGDMHVVRNSGLGLIVSTSSQRVHGYDYNVYKVYRIKEQDEAMYSEEQIEKV